MKNQESILDELEGRVRSVRSPQDGTQFVKGEENIIGWLLGTVIPELRTRSTKEQTKIFRIQWRHPNFGWNTIFILASSKEDALKKAKATPPKKNMSKELWNVITGYEPHSIKSGSVFYAMPDCD